MDAEKVEKDNASAQENVPDIKEQKHENNVQQQQKQPIAENNAVAEKKPVIKKKRKSGADQVEGNANGPTKRRRRGIKKRRRIQEEGAPKPPLTGYVRFLNERRDKLKPDHPDKSHIELTKILGDEWSKLNEDQKSPYLKMAEADKARYNEEMIEFRNQKRLSGQENHNPSNSNSGSKALTNGLPKCTPQLNGGGVSKSTKLISSENKSGSSQQRTFDDCIPIFTDGFLEHNKVVDLELRSLRKCNIDYEQQNSVLEKHIENMKTGVEKIENENKELAEKNRLLNSYLKKLKVKLAQALSGLPLPSEPNGATVDNIDKYMSELFGMVTSNSHSVNKAKDIIRKLDLHIQL